MSRRCEICGKGSRTGNRISHAHNVTRRLWHANLHRVRAVVKGGHARIVVCASCIRSGRVTKA